MNIRNATSEDAPKILDIYAPYITEGCVSFELEVPSLLEFTSRIESIAQTYPYIVYEEEGCIMGYAYATRFRQRAAYDYTVEVSIYLSTDYHGRGIGKALYKKLLQMLHQQGYHTVYAAITLPNEKSIGLHKSLGFTEAGIFHNAGYKHEKWHDLLWMEYHLKAL